MGAIIGFNEPDVDPSVAKYLSGADAAGLWPQIEQRAAELGIPRIGSPVTHTVNVALDNEAAHWYDEFFAACDGCQVDILVVHMYTADIENAKQALKNLHDKYGL